MANGLALTAGAWARTYISPITGEAVTDRPCLHLLLPDAQCATEGADARVPRTPLTISELYSLPAAVDLMTAARALNMGRTTAYELAKRGEFPCRVLRYGDAYRVVTAELLRLLEVPVPEERTTP